MSVNNQPFKSENDLSYYNMYGLLDQNILEFYFMTTGNAGGSVNMTTGVGRICSTLTSSK
ncbi:ABH_G0027240.mRNA.1.CDS.1 [Saccharomyces cerevisiae]|nr:ABH_G0027240.mRNA.1.CDS.1 [Saccharomyces cerevisiae]CAI6593569.1 ABH_G0027240.mRNA.1.CDS.1 [Saccharomyces cerevisiae]